MGNIGGGSGSGGSGGDTRDGFTRRPNDEPTLPPNPPPPPPDYTKRRWSGNDIYMKILHSGFLDSVNTQ